MLASDNAIHSAAVWVKRIFVVWVCIAAAIIFHREFLKLYDKFSSPWAEVKYLSIHDFKAGEDPDIEMLVLASRDVFGGRGVDVRDRSGRNACTPSARPRIGDLYQQSGTLPIRMKLSELAGGCRVLKPGEYKAYGSIILRPVDASAKKVIDFQSGWFVVTE